MSSISVYKMGRSANLHQTKIQRPWMDDTDSKHAYRCLPVSMANTMGWSISYDFDISFSWDGVSDSSPDHVTLLQGKKVCSTGRGNATISFETGLIFRTDPDVTLLSISPPNYFIDGAQAFTSAVSTSFFKDTFPCAWYITKPNTIITIPAGTPVATVIPISLKGLSDISVDLHSSDEYLKTHSDYYSARSEYAKEFSSIVSSGEWPNFYRNGVDHKGNKLGDHELPTLKLNVNDHTEEGSNG